MRRRAHDDRGAAAVEFALVLPVLVVITFGIIEFGNAYGAQLAVTNAARVAARSVAVGNSTAQAEADAVTAANGLPSPGDITFPVPPAPCPTDGTVVARAVTVQYVLPSITGVMPAITLQGKGAMLCNS